VEQLKDLLVGRGMEWIWEFIGAGRFRLKEVALPFEF